MKSGEFAIYRGKEYEASHYKDDDYLLYSYEYSDLNDGFEDRGYKHFVKIVKESELQDFFLMNSKAIYKGTKVGVFEEKGDQVLIGTSGDKAFAEQNGFTEVDRYEYEKWVKRNDLEKMWEEKKSYLNK